MIFAKGIANGYPLSGIVSSKQLMETLDVGSLGGTYAGNAVACAAGVAVQEVFATEDVEGKVARRANQLYSGLEALASSEKTKHLIAQVRGQGVSCALPGSSSHVLINFHSLAYGRYRIPVTA